MTKQMDARRSDIDFRALTRLQGGKVGPARKVDGAVNETVPMIVDERQYLGTIESQFICIWNVETKQKYLFSPWFFRFCAFYKSLDHLSWLGMIEKPRFPYSR
ncbi:hypothetical protein OAE63_00390 [bacterium]|nr:hypothetical protein [bacterium]